jgi:hypothetical protein
MVLHDNSELIVDKDKGGADDLVLRLPEVKPPYEVPVIELVLQ